MEVVIGVLRATMNLSLYDERYRIKDFQRNIEWNRKKNICVKILSLTGNESLKKFKMRPKMPVSGHCGSKLKRPVKKSARHHFS